jgi:hypothetical protein
MERIKVPSGSVQKLETVFDTLQAQQEENLTNRIDRLVKLDSSSNYYYGIIVDMVNGEPTSNDTSFKLTLTNGNAGWIIDKGFAITQSKEHVNFTGVNDSSARTNASYSMTTSKYYLVKLYYDWVGSDPVTAMNAFLFDRTGSEPYTSKNTVQSDSWEIRVQDITTEVGAGLDLDTLYPANITSDEIAIAIVKTHASNPVFDITTFTIDGRSSVDGVLDVRRYNRFLLNYKILDDQYVLLKDRDSIGTRRLNAKLEIGDDLYVTGATDSTPTIMVDYSTYRLGKGTNIPTTAVHVKDTAPIIRLHDSDATLFSQGVGYVDFYKGDESSFDTYDDMMGAIGFTENYSTKFYIQNDTAGEIIARVCSRTDGTETKSWKELTWKSPGRLGVLNSSPAYTVDITGTLHVTGASTLNDVAAGNLTLDNNLSVDGSSTFTSTVTVSDDVTVSNDLFIDVSANSATFGTDNSGTNVEIKHPTGPQLKLTIPNTGSYNSALMFSAGVSNPNTFVLAMDAATQTLRIDKDREFNYNYFVIDSQGRVILGDYSATDKFTIVNGGIKITEEEHNKAIKFNTTGPGQRRYDIVVGSIPEDSATGKGSFGIYDYAADKYRFVIDSQGRIGLYDVTEPAYTLDVAGSIHATANITTNEDVYGVNANFENITATNIITDTMSITSMNIGTMYTSDNFQGQTIRWPIDLNDVYDEGGLMAGITSDGVVTIGGAAFGANKLDNTNNYPDYLRVANSMRIFSTDVARLVFAGNTLASGIAFDYYNDQLQATGPLGVYQTWYSYNGTPATYTNTARIRDLTVTNKFNASSANITIGAITTNYLTVASIMQATSSIVNITTAAIDTLDVSTNLTSTGTTDLANLQAYEITASGVVTLENELRVIGDIYCGTDGAQQIVISGSSGQLNFYDSNGDRVLWIDDGVFGGLPGIAIDKGMIYSYDSSGGGGYTGIYNTHIFAAAGTSGTTYGLYGSTSYADSSEARGVYGYYSSSHNDTSLKKRAGVYGRAIMGGANTDYAIGVHGNAQHTGSGIAYAGYFENGRVHIEEDLYVDGTSYFGDTSGQRIELDGLNGNLYWYNPQNDLIIEINDAIFGSQPGIVMYGSRDNTPPDSPVFYARDNADPAKESAGVMTPYDIGVVNRHEDSYRAFIGTMYATNTTSDTECVWFKQIIDGDTSGTVYERRGSKIESQVTSPRSNDTVIGDKIIATTAGSGLVYGDQISASITLASNANNVYGSSIAASSNGTGTVYGLYATATGGASAYAGRFASGNVAIDNNLTVGGALTVTGATTWAANLAHTGSNVGFYSVTPTTRRSGYNTTGPSLTRSLNAVGQDFDLLKGVVKAIIDDLVLLGLFGN